MFFFNTYTDDNKCGSWDIDKIKLLFTILTAGFTVALTLVDSKTIFYSKKVKKTVKSKTVRKTKKVQSHTKAKRKIS